jgi:hypothetical protein
VIAAAQAAVAATRSVGVGYPGLERAALKNGNAALRGLEGVRAQRAQLDRLELDAVRTARRSGVSWERVATALGVTRSAAHQRFATQVGDAGARTE